MYVIILLDTIFLFHFFKRGRLPQAALIWMCLGTLEAWLVHVLLQVDRDRLFGGSSREHSYVYSWPKTSSLLEVWGRWDSHPLPPIMQLQKGRTCIWIGERGGDTRLASQFSWINPGNQWGDRCHRWSGCCDFSWGLAVNHTNVLPALMKHTYGAVLEQPSFIGVN